MNTLKDYLISRKAIFAEHLHDLAKNLLRIKCVLLNVNFAKKHHSIFRQYDGIYIYQNVSVLKMVSISMTFL